MKRLTLAILATLIAVSGIQAGWMRIYGGINWDEGRCVHLTVDSRYIVSGKTGDAPWFLKTDTLGNITWEQNSVGGNWIESTSDDGYVLSGVPDLSKTDSLGDTLWTKDFGIYSRCVRQTFDGGYILTGATDRLVLIKTDAEGDSVWMKNYLLSGWAYSWGEFVEQTSEGGYLVAGRLIDTTYENTRVALWLLKTDSQGDIEWSYVQGGENWGDYDMARCARETQELDYIAIANFGLLRINREGDTLWSKGFTECSSVQEKTNGEFILSGDVGIFSSAVSTYNSNGVVWLTNMDSEGDSIWRREYGSGSANWVTQTPDGGFIVTGQKDGDLFLLKTDSLGLLGIEDKPVTEGDMGWNVANTIGNHIVMSYEDMPQGFHAKVYDVTGRQIDEVHASGSWGTTFWGFEQPAGVYYIKALDNTNHEKSVKVVITD